jgi:putative DNA primase/helicase
MSERAPLPPIRFEALAEALLARAEHIVPNWLPGGVKRGHEWVCGSVRGEPGGSCCVNLTTGRWGDFNEGLQGGDLISLYAEIHGLTPGKAALQVARDEGLEDVAGVQPSATHVKPERPTPPPAAPKAPRVDEGWRTVRPVPPGVPKANFSHWHRKDTDIDHVAEYRHGADLHGYVVRFRTSDGGKDTLPRTWCRSERDGSMKWHWKHWDEPRPLYLPGHALPDGRTVILVEGEKKADALQKLLDAGAPGVYCVASWPGGCKAWTKAEWALLAGCSVILWPDCDSKREPLSRAEKEANPDPVAQAILAEGKPFLSYEEQPGTKAMLGIGAHLRDAQGCYVQTLVVPPPGMVADGWDCADAINTDGWDFERVLAFFGQAQPLPQASIPEEAGAAGPGSDGPAPARGSAGGGSGGEPPKKNDPPADAGDEGSSAGAGRGPEWLRPFWNRKKHYWMVSRELVIAALENDFNLVGLVAVNKLTNNIDLRRQLPGSNKPAGPMKNETDLLLGRYLSVTYGLPSISRAALSEAIETVAHQQEFHPVQEYLTGLHDGKVWDGTKRLDKWLLWVIGEIEPKTGATTLPPKVYEYLQMVGRFFLLGMVNRVMRPGCKFDYCMVLEGKGGLMKSTLFKVLAGKDWFSDTHFDVSRGKDGQEQVQGLWVYELAELASFSKADINLIKAFISAEVDRYRPSYGRVVEAYQRQCVLGGTTNEKHWLRDRTGNRRWWPVPVQHRIKIEWLTKYRDQLLAEAYAEYLEGARFYPLPEEEERLFVPMQDKRLVESTVMSALLEVLTRPAVPAGIGSIVNKDAQFVTIKQLNEALHVDAGKSSAALDGQIRAWLDSEGWEYGKKQVNGVRAHGYSRPKDWPSEAAEDDDTAPGVPAPTPVNPPPPLSAAAAYLEQEADDAPF